MANLVELSRSLPAAHNFRCSRFSGACSAGASSFHVHDESLLMGASHCVISIAASLTFRIVV
jgi:hypothetical protein